MHLSPSALSDQQISTDSTIYKLVQQSDVRYIQPSMLTWQPTSTPSGELYNVVWSKDTSKAGSPVQLRLADLSEFRKFLKCERWKPEKTPEEDAVLTSLERTQHEPVRPRLPKRLAQRLEEMLITARQCRYRPDGQKWLVFKWTSEYVERWIQVGSWIVTRATLLAGLERHRQTHGWLHFPMSYIEAQDLLADCKPLKRGDQLVQTRSARSVSSADEENDSMAIGTCRWHRGGTVKLLPGSLPLVLCITLRKGYNLKSISAKAKPEWGRSGDYLIPWKIVEDYRYRRQPPFKRTLTYADRVGRAFTPMLEKAERYGRRRKRAIRRMYRNGHASIHAS